MNVLSLFDGISCGMLALDRVGIKVKKYVAYEIDKHAIKTSNANYPQIKQCGDVMKADFTQYRGFNLLIGGSPCTHWSIAKTKDRETEPQGLGWELFQQFARAIKEAKPKCFIYENNKSMSPEIRKSINEIFGFEAILINSALVSAQNRQRLYWVGKRNTDGTYSKVDIGVPKDKGILIKDILETQHKAKAMFIDHVCSYDLSPENTLRVGYSSKSEAQGYRIYSPEYKSPCARAQGNGRGAELIAVPINPNYTTLCSDDIFNVKNGFITIDNKQYPIKLKDGYYVIRKYTLKEYSRLQTIPEWYKFPVSNNQAYKLIGNGWTVDIIAHILLALKEVLENDE